MSQSLICPQCQAENVPAARLCRQCGTEFEQPDPLIGAQVLDRYRVVSLIGEGGMGRVYLAEQRVGTTIRKVAVKTLRPQLSADQQLARRFFREAETIVRLTHPNIIQFFDFGELPDGTLVIVMEYIEGRSLAAELANGPLPATRADRIFTQICGALAEAHSIGIVHRDLKPDNILLTERGGQRDFVKVLDFGIAKLSAAEDDKSTKLTQQGMMVGTPPYMSPEQFSAEHIDARSDIYSLGVIAYEMLTGKLPFMAKTPWEWASKHLTAEPEPLLVNESSGISQRRVYAIRRALSKSRTERPQSVTDLLNEFTGTGVSATTGTMVQASASGIPPRELTPAQQRVQPTPVQPTPIHASTGGAATPLQRPGSGAGYAERESEVQLPTSRPWAWVGAAAALIVAGAAGAFMLTRSEPTAPPPPPAPVSAAVAAPVPSPPVAELPRSPQTPPAAAPTPAQPESPEPTVEPTPPRDEAPARAHNTRERTREGRDRPKDRGDTAAPSESAAQPVRPVTPAPAPVATPAPTEPKKPVRVIEPRVVVPSDLQDRLKRATVDAIERVEQALTQYVLISRKYGEDAPGVPQLKALIAKRGEQHLRDLRQDDDRCRQAQSWYRALAGIGAAPPKERHFDNSCKAP